MELLTELIELYDESEIYEYHQELKIDIKDIITNSNILK